MAGEPKRRNPNLYCQYHQDHGHMTEDCKNLWDHLEQLVREGKLKQLLHHSSVRVSQAGSEMRGDASSRLLLGTINVIFAALGRTGSCPSRVLSVFRPPAEDHCQASKRVRVDIPWILGFSDEDKVGTVQPHDDALVVTLRIGGYDVKMVIIDQGSAVDILYPDLYKGLGLKPEDLATYSSPLVSFEGRMVAPKGQIRLSVQTGMDVVEVDFIVVDFFSPYTTIMDKPWLHTLGAVSSTLHQKVKYPSGGQVLEIVGSQVTARQCLVGAKLPLQEKERLLEFLRANVDVFAWSPYEAPSIDSNFICHRLNVNPSLANTVVVKKKTGKWRMCMDFTNLNKACLKDPFPMPKID
ncbi:uncharacterized protein LOC126721260 [Quercus robur]|uniref:uncharacterized protein LOC126721260 n=1 Tax=Quercus robur TaxID=38942 RepID=UPI002162E547|nr:uncharacterized protein LOC126721260 [Quercus robur]